jgi:hypothetical protein
MKMKISQILLLVLFGIASCRTSKPNGAPLSKGANSTSDALQETAKRVTDTAAFVKNVVAQKSKYLNKEFGVLLRELDIPVKSYVVINSKRDRIDGLTLSFDDRKTTQWKQDRDDHLNQPPVLRIIWATPVPAATYNELRQKSMALGNWNSVEEEFYAKQIVGDIR